MTGHCALLSYADLYHFYDVRFSEKAKFLFMRQC